MYVVDGFITLIYEKTTSKQDSDNVVKYWQKIVM
jgi:hypothetical protein